MIENNKDDSNVDPQLNELNNLEKVFNNMKRERIEIREKITEEIEELKINFRWFFFNTIIQDEIARNAFLKTALDQIKFKNDNEAMLIADNAVMNGETFRIVFFKEIFFL